MKCDLRPDLAANFVTNAARAQSRPHPYDPKSTGITTLIDCLFKVYLKRSGQLSGEEDPLALMKPLLGTNSHEVFCKGGLEDNKYVEALQFGLRINGYIDLIEESDDPSGIAVGELKTTWAGATPVPNPHYIDQAAFYAALLGTLEARIYVVNVIPAKCHCFQIQFEKEELDKWMVELWTRALRLNSFLEGEPSSNKEVAEVLKPYHMDWQCKYCATRGTLCSGGEGKTTHWFEGKLADKLEAANAIC